MADTTISTSRQSCEPDYCDQLTQIDRPTMNKYSEIDESPSSDTEDQDQDQGKSVESNAVEQPLSLTNMIANKLKRKKKLSTSLTSVSEAVNQEKRTRIEGIQLNCRGKLNEELIAAATRSKSPSPAPQQQTQVRIERVLARTPQPSLKVAEKIILLQQQCHQPHRVQSQTAQQSAKVPPPRLKRKLEENVSIIQKLNAQTEQMRLEIAELKTHLTAERGAVRVLRAQNESETRKWKTEVKKLQTAMELMRKVKKSKEEACANWPAANSSNSSSAHGAKDATISNHELQRLTNEIKTLREANRTLEEKLQISNDAERRKAADLRELKDSYEIRLTQLSKSAKTEISRLLEEIKTKERNIGQLKRETQTLQKHKTNQTTNHNKKDTHPRNAAQHPIEMKKLKDIERNKNIINNNCNVTNKINTNNEKRFINTTCGEKEFHSMPHEITERILEAHNDVHAYGSKQDHQNSDSDSALSSAPPSISPQPPPTGMEPTDIWQTIRNYTKDLEKVQNELESIRKENETLQKELKLAKIQIKESEKTALDATNTAKLQQQQHHQLQERIKYLEQRENELQEETHELREQNELLEFRILELEESNDKWSLQSNTTVNNKNVWSNSGKESDDAIIFTDRSDSGVTSPHSHHHIDDRMNAISPCDLNLLDHIRTEDLRRHLSQMIKKPNIDEDDRMCLQHVVAFIQNVDVMSHDSLPSSEESSSLEYIKSRVSDYDSSSRSSDISPTLIVQKPKLAPSPVAGRIVATVLPYSSTVSTPNESPQRKLRAWNTSSLTESGVFEGDLSESSVQTQTEPEDFACLEAAAATKDLCTEIQKLNRFREKFEECFAKSPYTKVPVPSLPSLSPNLSDQKRIQFYKDRLDVLESKLLIYESSGDLQAKRLADRLQREIQLENLVKELRDRVDFLEVENAQLEEEKCEFEEAENDTRLRLQRLEVELEILSQRNIELEMSREALQNKLKDCRSESAILRDDLAASQTQICHLEEDRCRYKENFEFLHSAIPALILFNIFCVTTDMGNTLYADDAPIAERADHVQKAGSPCDCSTKDQSLRRESQNLREEVRSLKRQIGDLNSRHAEALTCADGFWEGMEREYNEKLMASKAKEEFLKQKIKQLEGCLEDDSRAANEKINQLEDAERELKYCLQRVSRDHREILKEHDLIREENQQLKEEYGKLKDRFEGPFKQAMEREKVQNKNLKEELGYMRRVSCEQEMHYRNELDCFQVQLDKLQKEFMQIQVTNSELKEEVCTLEKELVYLHEQKRDDLDKIRCLTDEVRTKEDVCALMEKRLEALLGAPYHMGKAGPYHPKAAHVNAAPSLAQELSGSPVKRIRMEEPKDLRTATKNLGAVLSSMKETNAIPSHKQFQSVANDVKKLAETLLAERSSSVEIGRHSCDVKLEGEPSIDVDKKVDLSEVPSDLRTIQSSTQTCKKPPKTPRKSLQKRFSQSLRREIRRIISRLNVNKGKFISSINSDQDYPSEVFQRRVSLSSFHSVQDDDVNQHDDDVFLDTVNEAELETEPWLDSMKRSKQAPTCSRTVSNAHSREKAEGLPPTTGKNFMQSLFESARKSVAEHENVAKIEMYVCQRFHNDSCFRRSLDKMVSVAYSGTDDDDSVFKTLTYEDIVLAMQCLARVAEIYRPHSIPVSPYPVRLCAQMKDRTRPTQNDRDRDHSNLSNQPNTEACAGQTQPSAGRHSNRHAKDNNDTCYDNNDHSDDDEEDEDECEDHSMDGQTCECRTTRNGVFTDHCGGSCIRHQTDEEAEPTEPHSTVKLLAKCCDNCGPKDSPKSRVTPPTTGQVTAGEDEPHNSAQLTEVLSAEGLRTRPATAAYSDEDSQSKKASKIEFEDLGCMSQSLLSPRPFRQAHLREIQSADAETPPSELEGAGQPPAEAETTSRPLSAIHSGATVQEINQTAGDQILPLLQSIYEVVRCLRDEKLQSTTARVGVREPPFTPLPAEEELCRVTEFPRPRLTTNNFDIETMASFEPPERDTDSTSSSKPRRLVPVDMDLLETFDWEMKQSVEETLQDLPTLSSNQPDSQPGQDDLTSAATEAEAFLKSTECLNCTATLCKDEGDLTPNAARFVDGASEKPHGSTRYEEENSKRTRSGFKIASDSPLKKSSATADRDTLKSFTVPQFLLKPTEIEDEHKGNLETLCAPADRPDLAEEPVAGTTRQEDILQTIGASRSNAKYHLSSISPCHDRWRAVPADLSFPASIEKVHELGQNSLFVKWKVQSLKNVAGYEIFVDGTLTNRYYSRIHRAAVICNVDLEYPHRIILSALPAAPERFSPSLKTSITSKDRPLATTPGAYWPKTNDTITWYPSVYHFEPTLPPATVSFDYNGCCASQS